MTQYTTQDLLIRTRAGEGEKTATDMVIVARAAQMGGDFSIMEGYVEPKKLLAPHTHEKEDQAVFVIEGELEFEVGGEGGLRFTARAGDYVLKPRGVQHCFWNASATQTVRYIELSGRSGFEQFVDAREKGVLRQQVEAKLKLGLTTHYLRIPKLVKEHDLDGLAGINLYGDRETE